MLVLALFRPSGKAYSQYHTDLCWLACFEISRPLVMAGSSFALFKPVLCVLCHCINKEGESMDGCSRAKSLTSNHSQHLHLFAQVSQTSHPPFTFPATCVRHAHQKTISFLPGNRKTQITAKIPLNLSMFIPFFIFAVYVYL